MALKVYKTAGGKLISISGRIAIASADSGSVDPKPDQMAAPSVTAGSGQITFAQPAIPNLHGLPLLQYHIRRAPAADTSVWTYFTAASFPRTIPGTNGTQYAVQQAAETAAGVGMFSISSLATPAAAPAAVPDKMAVPALTPGNNTVRVDMPDDTPNNGAAIDFREVRHGASSTGPWTTISPFTDESNVTGVNGTEKWFGNRAHNSVGYGLWSDAISTIPQAPAPGIPAATVTLTSLDQADIATLLRSWHGAANWAATAETLGISTTAERYVDLKTGNWGSFQMVTAANKVIFPAKVHVRSADKTTLGATFSSVKITDCENLGVEFVTLKQLPDNVWPGGNGGWNHCWFTSCKNGFVNHSQIRGPNNVKALSLHRGLYFDKCNTMDLTDTLITDWAVGLKLNFSHNVLIDSCVLNDMKGDDMKFSGCNNLRIINHWCSTNKKDWVEGDHMDYNQDQSGDNNVPPVNTDGFYVSGLIMYMKFKPSKAVQGMYIVGNGVRANYVIEDCVLCTNNSDVSYKDGTGWPDNQLTITRCSALYPGSVDADDYIPGSKPEGVIDSSGGPITDCVQALKSTTTIVGGGNLKIDCGTLNAKGGCTNYSAQHTYYTGPIQWDSHTKPLIEELRPVNGSQAKWDHANPKGAYLRLKGIFVDHEHPDAQSKNPVLKAYWHSIWNYNNTVT